MNTHCVSPSCSMASQKDSQYCASHNGHKVEWEDPIPSWIRTGCMAMLGTTHTTEGFSTKRKLTDAIREYQHLGEWSYFTEGQWSDRAKKTVKRYVGVIRND